MIRATAIILVTLCVGVANAVSALGSVDWAQAIDPASPPLLSAESTIVIEFETGRVLYEKDANTARFPASTTKILTTLLLLDYTKPSDKITAPSDVQKVGESSLHLAPGEVISADDMAYAMMLRSANDACYAVAKHVSDSVAVFADRMNERAAKIGCTNSHFTNPNGLHDALHYTCASDLALIARAAMSDPHFRSIVHTKTRTIIRSTKSKDTLLTSRNKLLWLDPTTDGIKTGYTKPAGHCFVGSAKRDGMRVITVVLKSESWKEDTARLTDWAFNNFEMAPVNPTTEDGLTIAGQSVHFEPKTSLRLPVNTLKTEDLSWKFEPSVRAMPIAKGQKVGTIAAWDHGKRLATVDAVAQESYKELAMREPSSPNYAIVGTLALSLVAAMGYAAKSLARL